MHTRHRTTSVLTGLVLTAAVVAGASACGSDEATTGSTATTAAEAAEGQTTTSGDVQNVSPEEFAALAATEGTVVFDVRTAEEYAAGHIDGAQNLDFQESRFTAELETLDKEATYAVYCQSGRRSSLAAEQMRATGFTSVSNLSGGLEAWLTAGQSITES